MQLRFTMYPGALAAHVLQACLLRRRVAVLVSGRHHSRVAGWHPSINRPAAAAACTAVATCPLPLACLPRAAATTITAATRGGADTTAGARHRLCLQAERLLARRWLCDVVVRQPAHRIPVESCSWQITPDAQQITPDAQQSCACKGASLERREFPVMRYSGSLHTLALLMCGKQRLEI